MENAWKSIKSRSIFSLFLLIAALCLSCGNSGELQPVKDGTSDEIADPCEGIDCGGNGRCLVAGGDTAVCVCDAGYHAEGLECVENVPGEECSGVDCSGHGTCVVVQGDPPYPVCICDEGYHNEGDTNCVEDESSVSCGPGTHEQDGVCVPDDTPADTPCVSNAGCDPGEVCSLETGDCEAVPPDECGLPPAEGGEGETFADCNGIDYKCADGFTCLRRWEVMDLSSGEYRFYYGYCQVACDPCAPECPEGLDCIKLPGQGGFCSPGPLHLEGEPCSAGSHWPWLRYVCAAGLNCYGDNACVRICVPSDEALWTTEFMGNSVASTSVDCPAGRICSGGVVFHSTDEVAFTCKPGRIVSTGSRCTSEEGLMCAPPDFCHWSFGAASGACSPDCNESPCPAGIDCFDVGITFRGSPVGTCVVDGSLGYDALCAEERNCEPWLQCLPDGSGNNKCLLPL